MKKHIFKLSFLLLASVLLLTYTANSSQVRAQETAVVENRGDFLASLQNPILDRLSGILPVVLYGKEVSLEQPTAGMVIIAAQSAEINAAVGKDVYALTLDLKINAPVGGRVMAMTTMAESQTPIRFTMYSPFAVGRMIAQEVTKPASESGTLSAVEASAAARLEAAKVVAATESAQLQAEIAAQIEATKTETKQSVAEQIQQKLQELTGKLPGLLLNQSGRQNVINSTFVTPSSTSSGQVTPVPTKTSGRFQLVKPVMAQTNEVAEVTETSESSEGEVEFASEPAVAVDWEQVADFFTKFSTILISTWLLLLLLPRFAHSTSSVLATSPLSSIGWGFVALITIPFASLFLLFTIVGIPISIVLFLLYIIGLMAAGWIVTLSVGSWLGQQLNHRWPKKWLKNPYVYTMIGAAAVAILTDLPGIGWIFGFLTLLAGFGSCIVWAKSWRQSTQVVQSK